MSFIHSRHHTHVHGQIFHLMELQGLGMDEACKALVVSKAVRRLMKEQGVSVVEALDDLIQRLSFSNLMASSSPPKINVQPQVTEDKSQEDLQITPLRPRLTPSLMSQRMARTLTKPILQLPPNKINTSTIKPDSQKIKNPRKRSVSEEHSAKEGRARADSVTEEVNAKLETRPKGKRDAVTAASQPAAKRPREA
jgi:hypothetical protein